MRACTDPAGRVAMSYLEIGIREETLVSLLAQRRLAAEDLRGLTPRARRRLRRALLQSLLSGPSADRSLAPL
ncbi:hypothetical protein [Microbulbifer halophilus]|uniref:Transcriptional regulator n=1 Tax=Microbulbifer halophilus TaxID=453963 RepID=A0ABW5EG65_9GAMM|nr:hypothetical protein [Microbulbifer halophilus]MCW8127845.1 hypothetical protein [Microbulbifer halophilus]